MNKLDIIALIENNPITKLNCTYQNKLLNKIKDTFTDTQQQLFIGSFYCYLNCDKNEFVISLDNVWKWLDFNRINDAKRLLIKHFNENVDYKILLPNTEPLRSTAEQKLNKPGIPKEQILMTIKTFKKFCMKARTDKADEIHDYYIKLETLLHETLNEESEDYKILLPSIEPFHSTVEQDSSKYGGHNKEQILMTIKTFKKFCFYFFAF